MSWLFQSGGQSNGASASSSVLAKNIQGWFPLGLTDLVSLLPKGLSRVFSTTTWKHQFFGAQPSLCVCLLLLIYDCGREWRRIWQPTPVFLPGKSYGQRSPTGCSQKCHKGSEMTEHGWINGTSNDVWRFSKSQPDLTWLETGSQVPLFTCLAFGWNNGSHWNSMFQHLID